MAKSAILSIRIVSNSKDAQAGLRRTAKGLDDIDRKSKTAGMSVQRMHTKLDRMSTVALKVGLIGSAFLSATSQVAAFSRSLAPMLGLTAALPGIFGAAGAGLATFKVATSGFGDALKAGAKGSKEFTEATKDMPPAMRNAARAMLDVNEQFAPKKQAVQAAFWDGMASKIQQVSNAYLPSVSAGMVVVAKSMNGVGKALADGLTSAEKFGATKEVFDAMARTMDTLAPAIGPVARGLSLIVAASAELLTGFEGAEAAGKRFEDWAARISTDGSLASWLENGQRVAGLFGDALYELVRVIGGVLKAASEAGGAQGVGALADSLRRVADEIAKPEIQTMLRDAFTQANEIVKKVVDLFIVLLPLIIEMGPWIMAAAGAWKALSFAMAIFKGLQIVGYLVAMGGAWLVALGPIGWVVLAIIAVGTAFVLAYQKSETFRNIVDGVAQFVWGILEALGQFIGFVFQAAWDAAGRAAQSFATNASAVFNTVKGAVSAVGSFIGSAFSAAWAAAGRAGQSFANTATSVVNGVRNVVSGVASAIGNAFRNAWNAAASTVGILTGAIDSAMGYIRGVIDNVAGAISNIMNAASNARGAVSGLFGGAAMSRAAVASTLPAVGVPFYLTAAMFTFDTAPVAAPVRRLGATYVTNVNVTGALDPAAVGRQVKEVLARSERRDGAVTAGSGLWT